MGNELGEALQEYMSMRWEHMHGIKFEIGIPDDPTDEDIRRILLFLEWGHFPANLSRKLIWVDRYWDEAKAVLNKV